MMRQKAGAEAFFVKTGRVLRLVSLAMLAIAVVFAACALSSPTLGRAVVVGNFVFGAEQWRVCYAVYIFVMAAVFAASFFCREKK